MSASMQPDHESESGQRDGQVHRDRGLSDPALPRGDGDDPGGDREVDRDRLVLLGLAPRPAPSGRPSPRRSSCLCAPPPRSRREVRRAWWSRRRGSGPGAGRRRSVSAISTSTRPTCRRAAPLRTIPRSTMLSPSSGSITPRRASSSASLARALFPTAGHRLEPTGGPYERPRANPWSQRWCGPVR